MDRGVKRIGISRLAGIGPSFPRVYQAKCFVIKAIMVGGNQDRLGCGKKLRDFWVQMFSIKPAKMAVRLGSSSSTIDSCAACAPSPAAPRPSRVGIPRAEVK